jgi:Holliday junction resolvase-like predicted endonuclease
MPDGSRGIFVYTCGHQASREPVNAYGKARGVCGETLAYCHLRMHGYVFVARNYVPRKVKGEIDLTGCDGETLVSVDVRTDAEGARG